MYVCVCLAVTESEVEAAIARGAHTREAVTRACRAGGDCGACHGMIDLKIEEHLDDVITDVIHVSARGAVSASGLPAEHETLKLTPRPLATVHADLVPADSLLRAHRRKNRRAA